MFFFFNAERELQERKKKKRDLRDVSFCSYHVDDLRVDGLRDDASVVGDIVQNLSEGLSLDLLALEFRRGVVEVKDDGTLPNLSQEQLLTIDVSHLYSREQIITINGSGAVSNSFVMLVSCREERR